MTASFTGFPVPENVRVVQEECGHINVTWEVIECEMRGAYCNIFILPEQSRHRTSEHDHQLA